MISARLSLYNGWLLRVKGIGSGLGNMVGCGHVYGVGMCNGIAARPDEYPFGEQVPLNRARSKCFGLIGVSWFIVSVCSPSPHFALTIPRAYQAACGS